LKAVPPYLMGADVGTSSCKVVLIDSHGQTLARARAGYATDFPHAGWAEQNPQDWYHALSQATQRCLQTANVPAQDVLALSVCGPAHNVVLLDRDGRVLQPVILWSDRRSAPQADWLEEGFGTSIYEITYQAVSPGWSLAQLLWVRQNRPALWQRVDRVIIGKDYLSYRLTGSWRTDWYDAMGTQMFDAGDGIWSRLICDILGLSVDRLPPVSDATDITGKVTPAAAEDTGLAPGTLVAVGSGDSVVEALGAGVVKPGQCIVKLGTAGNVSVVTAAPRPDRKTLTYRHVIPELWYTITATNSGASSANWFQDAFGLAAIPAEAADVSVVEHLAGGAPAGSEGLIFHPYLQGERSPYWDPLLRGDFVGITMSHALEHLCRAVLEGVAFSLRDCRELLRDLELPITEFRIMGGGARGRLWRQILADVFNSEMTVASAEATSYGAALVAGVAARVFSDLNTAARIRTRGHEIVQPDPKAAAVYARLFPVYRRVTQCLTPISHALGDALAPDA
jgi:xylulokinase